MQNDFLSDSGFYAKTKRSTDMGLAALKKINILIEYFRKNNLPIIFIHSLYGEVEEINLPINFIQPVDPKGKSKNIPFNDELRSGSHKQDLNEILSKKLKIKDLVIVGVATNYCVKATTIDAFHLGYNITIIEDAVGASTKQLHEKAILEIQKYYAKIQNTDQFTKEMGI
ncbi:Isochorismatase-like protein [Pseudocohnilembus persalinus]|uniref:Isochorismatase-like protein n=1 Tax=Pseudocohnilembus persalinus TaxID=266149 RepID=A0A0V0QSK9_PSEPJ|nr:Isochorismatase-like protein [Pseudocohnilembus persalinus]|eukprot:KRX04920.1 Isochorismatase-like protein [Pseudocohnilembus persalinus]